MGLASSGRCLATVMTLVIAGPPLAAQERDSARVAAVRSLEDGQRVRLDVARLGRLEGRFGFASDTTLTLRGQAEPTVVALRDVERLWTRGRRTGTGALVGAGVGLVAGAIYGFLIGGVACEPVDGGDCTRAEVAAVAGLLGGAAGAAVGAGVGYAVPVWRLRFP